MQPRVLMRLVQNEARVRAIVPGYAPTRLTKTGIREINMRHDYQ